MESLMKSGKLLCEIAKAVWLVMCIWSKSRAIKVNWTPKHRLSGLSLYYAVLSKVIKTTCSHIFLEIGNDSMDLLAV